VISRDDCIARRKISWRRRSGVVAVGGFGAGWVVICDERDWSGFGVEACGGGVVELVCGVRVSVSRSESRRRDQLLVLGMRSLAVMRT
jgi:hypothetical protein